MNSRSNHHDTKIRTAGAESTGDVPLDAVSKLGRDARRYFPAAIVPAAASLIGVLIYTRIFDSADYGRYSLVLAAVVLTNTLFSGWIQQSILRYLPRHKSNQDLHGFTAKASGLVIVVGLAVAVVLLIAYFVTRTHLALYSGLYLPALALLVAEIFFLNVNTIYQAGLKSKHYAAFKISAAIIRLVFALGFVFFIRRDVVGILIGAAAGQLLVVLPMARGLRVFHDGKKSRIQFDRRFLRTFAAYGLPMVGWTLGGQILNLSDRFIIGAFRGSAEVGIYSANYNLVNMGFGLVTVPLLMAAHPLVMNAWEKGRREKVPGIVGEFSRFYILAAFPVVVLVSVFSAEVVQLLLGPDFRVGHHIMPLILAGATAWGLAQLGHKGLEIMEKTRVMCSLVAVSAVVNVALNLIFVPRYGYYAAAVTTMISFVLYPILVFVTVRSYARWLVPWGTLGRAAAAALFAGIVLWAVKSWLPGQPPVIAVLAVGTVTGVFIYAVLLLLTRELKKEELNALLRRN